MKTAGFARESIWLSYFSRRSEGESGMVSLKTTGPTIQGKNLLEISHE